MLLQGLTLSENEGDLEVRELFFFLCLSFLYLELFYYFPLIQIPLFSADMFPGCQCAFSCIEGQYIVQGKGKKCLALSIFLFSSMSPFPDICFSKMEKKFYCNFGFSQVSCVPLWLGI